MTKQIKISIIVAFTTVLLDFTFHYFLTNPMESFDYFTVKFLLAFFIATIWINLPRSLGFPKIWTTIVTAAIFSFTMSLYYRWWEFFSSASYGARAPDIIFLNRENVIFFAGAWFFAHALFFIAGASIAKRLSR